MSDRPQTTQSLGEVQAVADPEQRVLGAIFFDGDFHDDGTPALKESNLQARHFGNAKNRIICSAMQALAVERAPINVSTVHDYLDDHEQLDAAGGVAYLVRLRNCVATSAPIQHDANKVIEAYVARKACEGLANLLRAATRPGDVPGVLADMSELSEELAGELGGKSDLAALAIGADELVRLVLPPRVAYIDGVLLQGVFSLLVGAPGTGKTWCMLDQAVAVASGGEWCGKSTIKTRVGILELENERRDLQPRILRICEARGLAGDDRNAALEDIRILSQDELGGRFNLIENWRDAAGWVSKEKLGALFIDSLQRTHGGNENEDLPLLATAYESIARTTGVGVEALHHENKAASAPGQRQSRGGDLAATRGLGVINDHAKIHMRLADCPSSATVKVLRWGKANLGRTPEPVYLELTEAGPLRVTDKPPDSTGRKKLRLEQVRKALEHTRCSVKDLLDIAGVKSKQTVYEYLRAVGATKGPDGLWGPNEEADQGASATQGDPHLDL